MSLDPAAIRRIARLARIRLDESDIAPMQADLSGILAWIEQLNEVDIEGVVPLAGGVQGVALPMREDVVDDGGAVEAVLANAPDRQGDFYAVPKVVE